MEREKGAARIESFGLPLAGANLNFACARRRPSPRARPPASCPRLACPRAASAWDSGRGRGERGLQRRRAPAVQSTAPPLASPLTASTCCGRPRCSSLLLSSDPSRSCNLVGRFGAPPHASWPPRLRARISIPDREARPASSFSVTGSPAGPCLSVAPSSSPSCAVGAFGGVLLAAGQGPGGVGGQPVAATR